MNRALRMERALWRGHYGEDTMERALWRGRYGEGTMESELWRVRALRNSIVLYLTNQMAEIYTALF